MIDERPDNQLTKTCLRNHDTRKSMSNSHFDS